jgi:hypothetical protein
MKEDVPSGYLCTKYWYSLGNRYYSKIRCCSIVWGGYLIEMKSVQISSRGKFLACRQPNNLIKIYSLLNGKLIGSIKSGKEILFYGWFTESSLAIIEQNCIKVYELKALSYKSYELKSTLVSKNIYFCFFDGSGNIFLFSDNSDIFVIYSHQEVKCDLHLVDTERSGAIFICLLHKRKTLRNVKDIYYIIFNDRIKLFSKSTGEIITIHCSGRTICAEISPDENLFATYSTYRGKSVLNIYSTTQLNLCHVVDIYICLKVENTHPFQIAWCGNHSVAIMSNSNILYLFSLDGEQIQINVDENVKIFSEIDGLHIVGFQFHDFIREIPMPIVCFSEISSAQPIRDCLAYKKQPVNINTQSCNPFDLIHICANAALHEMRIEFQVKLMRLASYYAASAASIADDSIKELIHSTCDRVRKMNLIRKSFGGLLTFAQLEELETSIFLRNSWIVDLLYSYANSARKRSNSCHFLLRAISKRKFSKSFKHHLLSFCESLQNKYPSVSSSVLIRPFTMIGALDVNLHAISLELSTLRQIEALLELRVPAFAISKAVECKDVDLVYKVFLCLKQRLKKENFSSIIKANCKYSQLKYLLFPLSQSDLLIDSVFGRGQIIIIDHLRRDFPDKFATYSKLMREFTKITKLCSRILGVNFIDFISFLLDLENDFEVQKFHSYIQVPDEHMLWILTRFHTKARNWGALQSLLTSRKNILNVNSLVEFGKRNFIPNPIIEKMRVSEHTELLAEVDFIRDTQEALHIASKSVHTFTLKATDFFEKLKTKNNSINMSCKK